MFNDSQSFYYSENADLTNTVQRNVKKDENSKNLPVWKTVGIASLCLFGMLYCDYG